MRWGYVAVALLLAGCTETVLLRNGAGMTVKCGPYETTSLAAQAAAIREAQCIQDYQRQGYERVPE